MSTTRGGWLKRLGIILLMGLLVRCECDDEGSTGVDTVATGTLIVETTTTGGMPDPDGYTIIVEGASRTGPANGQTTFAGVSATLQIVMVRGLAPNCELTDFAGQYLATVPPGGRVTVVVEVQCPILASLDVTITGLPPGVPGNVDVSSIGRRLEVRSISASTTIEDLWPGRINVFGSNVTSGGVTLAADPISQSIDLGEGESGSATVTYTGGTGSLDVVVAGLPPGMAADISVDGPDGFTTQLTGSTTLDDLPTGDYTVTAEVVGAGGVSYAPDPLTQTAPVAVSATTSATVTYAVTSRAPVVFEDDFTAGDLWTETVTESVGGSTSTAENRASAGVSGGYRHMTHVFPGQGSITVHHLYGGGSYNPSVEGAIDHINYSEWRIQRDPPFATAAIGSRFVLIQNGVAYTALISGSGLFANQAWEMGEARGLVPSDFAGVGPDFSDQGGEIVFGFMRSNSTGSAAGLTTTHGIDDWRVEIIRVQN